MIYIRALPLSFHILWRFLIQLPVWTLFYMFISIFVVTFGLSLAGSIPFIGGLFLIPMSLAIIAISYLVVMHPYLIGLRIGLRRLGADAEADGTRLLKAGVIFGFIEAVVVSGVSGLATGVWLLMAGTAITFDGLLNGESIKDPVARLSEEFVQQALVGGGSALAAFGAISALAVRAMLFPSLAWAAAGKGRNRFYRPYLSDFAKGFWKMLFLLLGVTALSMAAAPLLGGALQVTGLFDLLSGKLDSRVFLSYGQDGEHVLTAKHLVIWVGMIALSIWLFCYQCAAVALTHVETQKASNPDVSEDEIRQKQADMRQLLSDRMQG